MVSVEKNKAFITSFIVLIFVFLSFLLAGPIIEKANKQIEAYKDTLVFALEKKLGIIISYEKMTPSIINSAKISNIIVFDTKDNSKLAIIPSIRVYFSILSLLRGNFDNFISAISINGLEINYDDFLNSHILENIQSFIETKPESEEKEEKIAIYLPFAVHFNALTIHYKNEDLDAQLLLKTLKLLPQTAYKATGYKADGAAKLFFYKQDLAFLNNTAFNFSAQGSLASFFDVSFLQLRVSKLKNDSFILQAFDLAIIHENDMVRFSFLQNAGAIALKASYDLHSKDIIASLKTFNFSPQKLVEIKNPDSQLHIFNSLRLSGDFSCIIPQSDLSAISYNYDMNIAIPDNLFPQGLNLNALGSGNLSKILVKNLNAKGKLLDIDFNGSYIFNTMKPEGFAKIQRLQLPSQNELSFELYIDATRDGFMLFVPQLEIGEKAITALELELIPKKESWDFTFYGYDYSHYEYMTNAEIFISGSLLLEKQLFLQTNIAVSNLFLDSIFSILEYSLAENAELFQSLKNNFPSFLTSTELYFSTDFKQFSYNIPYAIIANTAKDKELALFSLGGNESSLSLTQFDLLFANQSLESTANFDFLPGFSDAFFTMSLVFNSIPYEIQGGLVDKQNIFISGSYGMDALLHLGGESFINGNFEVKSLPLAFQESLFSLSVDLDFYYNSFSDWYVDLARLDLSNASENESLAAHLFMAGFIDPYGATIHDLQYSDKISMLDGFLLSSWAFSEGVLSRANVNIELNDALGLEQYLANLSITNPLLIPFNVGDFLSETYVTAEISVKNSPTERFLSQQNTKNLINIDLHVLGSLDKPSLSFNIFNSAIDLQGIHTNFSTQCLFENNIITILDGAIETEAFSLHKLKADFDIQKFSGSLNGNAFVQNLVSEKIEKSFEINLLSLLTTKENNNDSLFTVFHIPESYSINCKIPNAKNTAGIKEDFLLSLNRSNSRFDIQGGFGTFPSILANPAIQGYFTDLGDVLLLLDESLPLSLLAYGKIDDKLLDLNFSDVLVDVSSFRWFLDFGEFKILKGLGKGSFAIGGYTQDPEFSGSVEVRDFECEVPNFIPGIIRAETGSILAEDKTIRMPDILGITKKGTCTTNVALHFDKWMMERVDIDLVTPKKERVFVDADFGLLTVEGNAACDLHLEIRDTAFSITGSIDAEDAFAKIYPSELMSQATNEILLDVYTDLDIRVGMRSQISLFLFKQINPIVRSLISPNTQLRFYMNSRENLSYLEGDMVLKGGEVNIGRSFYIKEGKLSFEESQGSFDPVVNLVAELRERDTTGEFVKITLSALNQRLSTFDYTLASSPPKSEVEIMSLLGKTLVYDPTGSVGRDVLNVIGLGLDTFVQSTILREAEDRLRDFFKLDILTLRTSMLQNAIRLYSEDNAGKSINPGNFLDDSSVYIGKYLGDVLYGDFLLHLTYDESKGNPNAFASGLSFQPELGLEMEAPFATIRWGLAPDVESFQNLWVPYTSLSISWKFMF